MILMMYLVDTIGLTPGIYPGYQWYVWGFIGLALRGVDGLTDGRPQDAMSWNLSEDGGNTVGV
jgi:hypothetical protein